MTISIHFGMMTRLSQNFFFHFGFVEVRFSFSFRHFFSSSYSLPAADRLVAGILPAKSLTKHCITESRPLKYAGQKKWGTQDALRAHKGMPPSSVPFDFKNQNSQKGVLLSLFETMGAISIVIKCKNVLIFNQC